MVVKQARILVTDARRGSAIAVIRSLAKHGYHVIAADSDPRSPGLVSRYARQRIVYACPQTNPQQFIDDICEAVRRHQVDLIIPVTDLTLLPMEAARERIERICKVPWPPRQAAAIVRDKDLTFQLAARLNIPYPRTRLVHSIDEAVRVAPQLGWPVVLKPKSSLTFGPSQTIDSWTVAYAQDEQELRTNMQPFEGRCPVLLQEYFAGAGVGVEVLADAGELICAFQHRRLREVPLSGGVSSLRRSEALDPILLAQAAKLFKALGWRGLAMAEFKQNARGETRLMEINGRIWGSLPVAVAAGVDFPVKLCELLLSGPPADKPAVPNEYRTGLYVQNFHKELSWIAGVLKPRGGAAKGSHPLGKLPPRRAALRVIVDLLNPAYRFDILSLGDPLPGLRLLGNLCRSGWGRSGWRRTWQAAPQGVSDSAPVQPLSVPPPATAKVNRGRQPRKIRGVS